jgi:glycosyltransferase involved in cell wall biosynthesis
MSVEDIPAIKKLAEEAVNSPVLRDVDVFHCQGLWTNFETYIGLFLSRLLEKPLVFQIQGHFASNVDECTNLDQKKFWYDPAITNEALNHSKVIICMNKITFETVRTRTANKTKLAFIPTCIDTNQFLPINNQTKLKRELLFLARLTPFKDPITPIRAIKIVAKVKPDVKLKIVGGGPLAKRIRLLVKELGLEQNVVILGEHAETKQFFQESAIFLAMSTVENFLSNSLLEAMASGLAIIATDVGETRNVIKDGENGILVPPKDPAALANALLTLLSNQSFYENLSKNALETAKQYDINTLGPKFVEIYKEATSEF